MHDQRRPYGIEGESRAEEYLKHLGYRIIRRNFRSRFGEVDLIAYDGETLVFIEVKRRATAAFGSPQEAVHAGKQDKIARTAQFFLLVHGLPEVFCRFDVIAIGPSRDEIHHLKDAFHAA